MSDKEVNETTSREAGSVQVRSVDLKSCWSQGNQVKDLERQGAVIARKQDAKVQILGDSPVLGDDEVSGRAVDRDG